MDLAPGMFIFNAEVRLMVVFTPALPPTARRQLRFMLVDLPEATLIFESPVAVYGIRSHLHGIPSPTMSTLNMCVT